MLSKVMPLKEHQWQPLDLQDEDAEFIATELGSKISIQRLVGDDPRCSVNPNQYVGIITLPTGLCLESYPKVPVQNLFCMLAVAVDYPSPFRKDLSEFQRLDQLLEFVAGFFADLVDEKLLHGLYRAYIDEEGKLPFVRGRIDFSRHLRENYVTKHKTYCRYSELTWDIPENQILRQVAYMLNGWEFGLDVRKRLSLIDAALYELSATNYPASIIERFQYHRLNEDYRQLHHLCQLFLEGASLSEELGTFSFRTFLLDMNLLFEMFVTKVLEAKCPLGVNVRPQVSGHLDADKKVDIRPDLVIEAGGNVALVDDCKYEGISPDEYKNYDIYQVLSYCLAEGTSRGLLIYPRHISDVDDIVYVLNTKIEIRRLSFDLGKPWHELELECSHLARKVFSYVESATRVPA